MNRTLTKNEQILLTILIIVIIFIVTFRFVLTPQASKLEELKEQRLAYEEEIAQINTLLKSERNIDKEWMELHNEEAIIHNKYFPAIDQPEIINLLNDILNDTEIDILDIHFDRPSEEQIGESIVKTINVNIPYKCKFENLISVIDGINSSPKKMLISNLIMDKDTDGKLVGNILLKVYALEGIIEDIKETSSMIGVEGGKLNPFEIYDGYVQKNLNENITKESVDIDNNSSIEDMDKNSKITSNSPNFSIPGKTFSNEEPVKEILEDFEEKDVYFIPSHKYIKGHVSKSNNSKSNKHSLRLEYNILALEDENRAYIDLTDKSIILKYPPTSIGIWVYSYSYSPSTLGYILKEQYGEKLIETELSKGIDWVGWKYIEASPPQDISLYPLQLEKIYIETNKDDYGVLLIDELGAKYPNSMNDMKKFTFYIVEPGDTLRKISTKNYGNPNKVDLIMKHNEIKSDNDLWIGKILVIPK
ncbi:type IV pilus assembly protein PilO [Keratinibaculum paraultunense]|uniref:Type IV pilus assembly protein PilO n=1 Tax=Keratinibaculum paraultunense TaxID=1278232 RepID=A0A4R3L0B4_9FIRM|nr:LysM peptidoglycan-binding domain-containing protein [Keratinibaculum paraultunense]QQY80595.1 LysM peptidoglycan-binding domain-containing protein [Keratinibaculum paraultunense]TCS91325.1 type IV pilus assembly protein PilO [Keratinibaculum paraultunense]